MTLIYALRSLLFYLLYTPTLIVWATLVAVIGLFLPALTAHRFGMLWVRFAMWWAKVACGIDWRIEGAENIPQGRTAVVLAKHQSVWETLFLQVLFFPTSTVAKRELLWIPFFGWGFAKLHPIAINRSRKRSALQQVVEQGGERLKEGRWILIFPEGTRTRVGERRRYATGGAILAHRNQALVLPVSLNAGDCWPKGNLIKRPGLITVVIGQPLDSRDFADPQTLSDHVADWIERQLPRISANYPAGHHYQPDTKQTGGRQLQRLDAV